jgi:two-component system, sensor histidine kinase and response regulator
VPGEIQKERPAVLLVDDIEANLLALEGQLSSLGCEIVRARSGNDALRQLLKREFAVMLLDVQMPEMDGYEVARLVRENPATRELPIVFVTAMHETEESMLQGYGSGAIDFLFKPVNPRVLRSKVQVFLDLDLGRRRLLNEIEAHKRTLAELEAFNYSVSHDLRAPLRPLDGFCKALIEDYGDKLDDTAKHHLERIRAAAKRMGELIDDLLELSRISQTRVKWQPVDLAKLARSVMDELVSNDPGRDIELVVTPTAEVRGDPGLLQIMLENLLRNAWKFTRGRARPRIEFGKRMDRELVYFVRDDGVGFDPAFASRLFQPFQRMHAATDFEGTGIGLAIVNRIIGGHGGKIWAESAVDKGATFCFTLGPAAV